MTRLRGGEAVPWKVAPFLVLTHQNILLCSGLLRSHCTRGEGNLQGVHVGPLPHLLDHGLGNKIPEALATGPESACMAWVASSLGPLPRSDHFYSTDFVGMMGGQGVAPGRGSGWSLKVGLAWSLVV